MFLFKSVAAIQAHLYDKRSEGEEIGYVPTMGALHSGHGSLVQYSINEGYYTVVSIYVNPTQFNDPEDLENYPRTIDKDLDYLHRIGCDVVFLPSDSEVYPDVTMIPPKVELGHLNTTLEAAFRPGHFEGVLQVVHRLLEILEPDYLFMGKKDLQQLTIIMELIRQEDLGTELIGMPIVREPNGLARSSRNERLSLENRKKAGIIYQVLQSTAQKFSDNTIQLLKEYALIQLNVPPFKTEYFEFVRSDNLKVLNSKKDYTGPVSIVTAVWCGDVRLIDNYAIERY